MLVVLVEPQPQLALPGALLRSALWLPLPVAAVEALVTTRLVLLAPVAVVEGRSLLKPPAAAVVEWEGRAKPTSSARRVGFF